MRALGVFLAFFLLTGCSYESALQERSFSRKKLSIPYAAQDGDGTFTAILYEKMAKRGLFTVTRTGGDLKLDVILHNSSTESVGFRYETDLNGNLGQRLVASEEELTIMATITLIDCKRGCRLLGPLCVKEEMRFDFAPDTSPQNDTTFSAGQLDFEPAAKDAALERLYHRLSERITELLWVYSIDHAL